MRTRNAGRVLLVAATLLTFEHTGAASDNKNGQPAAGSNLPVTAEVRLNAPSGNPGETATRDAPNKQVIRPAISWTSLDQIDKNVEKLSTTMQKMFKDFRPGCRSLPARRPTSSWPSRGETAVSVCR